MRRAAVVLVSVVVGHACGSDEARDTDARPEVFEQADFGRPCSSDQECASNACVPHIGDTVCTQNCDFEHPCPDQWTCWTPPASDESDGASICVSPFWSLCRPCSANADCASLADDEPGVCVDYNGSGTFCGSDCIDDRQCPDGFSCQEVAARDGQVLRQCVDDSGMCECNPYIAGLGEATRCATENDYGRCLGERTCDSKLWSRCDAITPGPDAPNLIDDDCDGETDELVCLCGDLTCDGACGETLANCPCDCAAQGDGICSPCGESPTTSPEDCCRGPGGTFGCGDGACLGFGCGENPATCPEDCSTACGNELCEPGENPFNCAEDCKHEVCGNNVCESSDGGPEQCPQDCDAFCGDCECDPARDESVFNCAIDCGHCGDGSCSVCATLNESPTTCAIDCCIPSAEACNGVDDDCDGTTDEPDAIGCRLYYRDDDDDGLGRWDDVRCLCAGDGGWDALTLGDCDDGTTEVSAGDPETCNAADDDCDGLTDEDFDLGAECEAPGGACFAGVTACEGPDRMSCVDGPPVKRGTVCGELVCADGIIYPPALCDGAGACVPLPPAHCDGYLCDDAGRCETTCANDDECREGYACGAGGVCEQVGDPCTGDGDCRDQNWSTLDFCLVVCGHGERVGVGPDDDTDGDGVANGEDVCPETSDPTQADRDGDGRGDACDLCEGAGGQEICNGADDDCDGATDEGFGVGASCLVDGQACRVGARACDGQGDTQCVGSEDAQAGTVCGDPACEGGELRLASRCDAAGVCVPGALLSCQGFACLDGADGPSCADACVDHDDCAAGYHCAQTPDGGACAPDLAIGAPCGDDVQCASDMCIDGFCCATDCTGGCFTCGSAARPGQCVAVTAGTDPRAACGPCASCNAAGQCANAPAGPSPKDACPVEPPCGGTGLCDGRGECRLAAAGTSCGAASCVAGTLAAGTTCDGAGTCLDATASACPGDLLCASASACLTRCTSDRDCRVGNYCDAGGACQDLRPNGQTCSADRMCASGICADGLCCNARCDGDCQSCATATAAGTCTPHANLTDPENECGTCGACNGGGACGPHAAGTDPDNDCAVRAPCGQNGFCNGAFGCAPMDDDIACGDADCIGSTLISERVCDGLGSCGDPDIEPCDAYMCGSDGACRTTCTNDSHCQGGFICDGGECIAKQAKGAPCTRGEACQSGFCVDGACCENACDTLCHECGGADAGSCKPIDGTTDGACSGTLVCENGGCKRADGAGCSADGECASGHCSDGVCCNVACDGSCEQCDTGTCVDVIGAQYDRCDETKWCDANGDCVTIGASDCDLDGDALPCPAGHACVEGQCILPAADGTDCEIDGECDSGHCVDGVCCESACTGLCRACNESGHCELLAAGTASPSDCPNATDVCGPAGTCKKKTGGTCVIDTDCANLNCVDGKCCGEVCGGVCVSCASGSCQPVTGGLSDPGTCPAPSVCAGANNCLESTGTSCTTDGECSSNECVLLSPTLGYCCNTTCSGQCKTCLVEGEIGCQDVVRAENPGQCEGAKWCDGAHECVNKDGTECEVGGDCADGYWCDLDQGKCKPKRNDGQACTVDESCASGHCTDDVCCEAECGAPCEECDASGRSGECTLLPNLATDPACPAGELCSRATGGCASANGADCGVDDDCASGHCVAGVCCDRVCDGECEACDRGADTGTCVVVTKDTTDTCDDAFACDDLGNCDLAAGGVCFGDEDCASGRCGAFGACCDFACTGSCDRCELDGSCTEALSDSENPLFCEDPMWCQEGTCEPIAGHTCVSDADCPAPSSDGHNYYCDGVCKLGKPNGAFCSNEGSSNANPECESGWCSGNTCCESECHGTCQTCSLSGFVGECVPAVIGDDPGDLCGPSRSCNGPQDGDCGWSDGVTCAFDYECASGVCDQGRCCHEACSGTCERCKTDGSGCELVATGQTDPVTCTAPNACDNGVCKLGLGDPCTVGTQCATGFCADTTLGDNAFAGVCCDAACNGACENCDALSGHCDDNATRVFDPELCTGAQWCDASGTCRTPVGSPCDEDGECPSGLYCDPESSACAQKKTPGSTCTHAAECDRGICTIEEGAPTGVCCQTMCDGACTFCDPGGVCRNNAPMETGQCTAGQVCDGKGMCAAPNGTICTSPTQCASGNCVDQFPYVVNDGQRVQRCCEGRCDGLCQACSNVGACTGVTDATDDFCGAPFECAGTNVCRLADGQPCSSPLHCASGVCEDSMCCGMSCGVGFHCVGSTCAPDFANGVVCTVNTQCTSGNCVNGRCCGAACPGACQTCNPGGWGACDSVTSGNTTACQLPKSCTATAQCMP